MAMSFQVTVQQYADTEDLFIEIPEEIIQQLGWEEGDELDWQIEGNCAIIRKVQDTNQTQGESNQTYERRTPKDFIKTKGQWF